MQQNKKTTSQGNDFHEIITNFCAQNLVYVRDFHEIIEFFCAQILLILMVFMR